MTSIFDKDILPIIVKYISDAETWFNLSQNIFGDDELIEQKYYV